MVAEVSKAGGFGVLGGAGHTPESLDIELNWIDEQVNGAPLWRRYHRAHQHGRQGGAA